VLDQAQRLEVVLEEEAGAQGKHVDSLQRPQPPLLPVQAGDRPRPRRLVGPDAAEEYDVADAALSDRADDRLTDVVLKG
jgi:hypothetical protein